MQETGRKPPVLKWYMIYCMSMMLLHLAVSIGGVVAAFINIRQHHLSAALLWVVLASVALVLHMLFLAAPFLPARPWAWVCGLILLGLGLPTCCLPACVPLLIHWIKPETRRHFGRPQ